MKAYHIVQWDQSHEYRDSRRLERIRFYTKPNSHQGVGYRFLAKQNDRNDLLAAWSLLLDVASQGYRAERGWLVRKGRALTALDLELLTGFPEGLFTRAFEFFTQPHSGWLEEAECPHACANPAARLPHSCRRPAADLPQGGRRPAATLRQVSQNPRADTQRKVRLGKVRVQDQKPSDNKGTGPQTAQPSVKEAVLASRTQFASLARQEKELAALGEEAAAGDRLRLGRVRAALRELEEKQARGEF